MRKVRVKVIVKSEKFATAMVSNLRFAVANFSLFTLPFTLLLPLLPEFFHGVYLARSGTDTSYRIITADSQQDEECKAQ